MYSERISSRWFLYGTYLPCLYMGIADTSFPPQIVVDVVKNTGHPLGVGWNSESEASLHNCDCGLKLVSILKFEKYCSRTLCKQ